MSFLTTERKDKYSYHLIGKTIEHNREAYIIEFKPLTDDEYFQGKLIIDVESKSLISALFRTIEGAPLAFAKENEGIKQISRTHTIDYINSDMGYTVSYATVNSQYEFILTGDTIECEMVYVTTNKRKENFRWQDSDVRLKALKIGDDIEDGQFRTQEYWKSGIRIVRPDWLEKKLKGNNSRFKETAKINFLQNATFSQIKEKHPTNRKNILIYYTADWCLPCKEMEKTTFQSPMVKARISDNYHAIKIDVDRNKHNASLKLKKGKELPGFVILSPWGQKLGQEMGSKDSKDFCIMLDKYHQGIDFIKIDSLQENISDDTQRNAAVLREYGNQLKYINPNLSKNLFSQSLGNLNTWHIPWKMKVIFEEITLSYDSPQLAFLVDNKNRFYTLYDTASVNDKINDIIYTGYVFIHKDKKQYSKELKSALDDKSSYYYSLNEVTGFKESDQQKDWIKAFIKHHTLFPSNQWSKINRDFLKALINTDHKNQLVDLGHLLDKYRSIAIDYEWLDLKSILLYKQGDKSGAINLVREVREKALIQKVNFQSSLHLLRKK